MFTFYIKKNFENDFPCTQSNTVKWKYFLTNILLVKYFTFMYFLERTYFAEIENTVAK